MSRDLHVVTGGLGYSGKYIVARLLQAGCRVRTITNSPNRPNPFGDRLEILPLSFNNPAALVDSLRDARALYNTYWVRFNHGAFSHEGAVQNTLTLFNAASQANVGRIIHISITNPSENSSLGYFRGKARLEQALMNSGLSYAILRPAILFGKEDILINNIAWALRHVPIFGIFGDGSYQLQPIYVDDLAQLAVKQGESDTNTTIDATGPETFTFRELVRTIGTLIGKPKPILQLPPSLGYALVATIGLFMRDVVLTRDEIRGLMQGLLATSSQPSGKTRLTDWIREHSDTLGVHYANELARRLPTSH